MTREVNRSFECWLGSLRSCHNHNHNNNNNRTVFRSPLSPEAVRRWSHTSHAETVPAHGSCPVRSFPVWLPIGDLWKHTETRKNHSFMSFSEENVRTRSISHHSKTIDNKALWFYNNIMTTRQNNPKKINMKKKCLGGVKETEEKSHGLSVSLWTQSVTITRQEVCHRYMSLSVIFITHYNVIIIII